MAQVLRSSDPRFDHDFSVLVSARRGQSHDVQDVVRDILNGVKSGGDAALSDYTKRFDKTDFGRVGMRVSKDEMKAATDGLDPALRDALEFAHDRIKSHHKRQLPSSDHYRDDTGAELGSRWTPVQSVGLYVPGGKASYPSSVLMNAIPAKVAGVGRIVMVVPAQGGEINPAVLAAAHIAGVDEVYRVGGAQAVAALAFGTESICAVAKIVGPGNAYVAEAKRQVFGIVGIDTIAGPSEVVVVADRGANPEWIAADLLAQAEHDEAAQSILITDDSDFAQCVGAAVRRQLEALPRRDIAAASWNAFGAIVIVGDLMKDVAPLVNALAPEHLELACESVDEILPLIVNAGAIFVGPYTPEAVGDYVAGSNHVLPTSRAARFASGLGVLDFMKRTSILRLTPASLAALGPPTMILASAEGLDGHRNSVGIRLTSKAL